MRHQNKMVCSAPRYFPKRSFSKDHPRFWFHVNIFIGTEFMAKTVVLTFIVTFDLDLGMTPECYLEEHYPRISTDLIPFHYLNYNSSYSHKCDVIFAIPNIIWPSWPLTLPLGWHHNIFSKTSLRINLVLMSKSSLEQKLWRKSWFWPLMWPWPWPWDDTRMFFLEEH